MTALRANPALIPSPSPEVCAEVLCTHCSLPVPSGLLRVGEAEQFCCTGCQTAYEVINSCGLERYYEMARNSDAALAPMTSGRRAAPRAYAEFDDPAFQAIYCRELPGGLMQAELVLEGVHCAACVWLVEKLPRVVPGVIEARLDLGRSSVAVTIDPARATLAHAARALHTLGYPPHPARAPAQREARKREDRAALIRIGVAGACAGNIMLLFIALYAGMFEGIDVGHERLFRWTAMLLNTLCLAWPGAVFLRGALAAIRVRAIHLDVPIALGLYLGGAWGIVKTITGGGGSGASDIYFDSISALIFFLLIGRFLQMRGQRAASDALELLFSLTPAVAHRVDGAAESVVGESSAGAVREVPTEALAVGDLVEILPGESIPADGVIERGASSVDCSLLSGESRPIAVAPGDDVAAGTVNISSVLRVRVRMTGQQTRVGRLMQLVQDAAQRRAAIVLLADRWGARLLWILLGLAAITMAIWWHLGPAVAIDRAAALLIATCPCGLGLATPLAMTVAIGRAARRGILIKGGDALQSLAHSGRNAGTIILDKTGTVTFGRLAMVRWTGTPELLARVGALEACSTHPVAAAFASAGAGMDARAERVVDVRHHPGAGIEGVVDGVRIAIGTRCFIETLDVAIDAETDAEADRAVADGYSPVYVAVDGHSAAVAALGDPIRPEALRAVQELTARGWRVRMLSGDHPEIVAAVGRTLGFNAADCRGGITPEGKLDFARESATHGTTIMIGDGVNDAAALAAATVGIAVRGGAEASLAAADVSLSREGLDPVLELLDGAKATMRTIRWTIVASLAYNIVAATLSIAGLISPLLAAFIMPASSLTVLGVCLSSRAFRTARRQA